MSLFSVIAERSLSFTVGPPLHTHVPNFKIFKTLPFYPNFKIKIMTVIPDDLDFCGRFQVYRGYPTEEPYLDKRSIRRQRKSLRYHDLYPKMVEWAVEDCILLLSRSINGDVGLKIIELCQNALLERAKDMVNQTRVVEISYYVRAVKRANPSRTIRDARWFYHAQRWFCYKIINTIEAIALIRFRALSNIHPLDRFDITHPVFTIDPAFDEAVEILKVFYALEN